MRQVDLQLLLLLQDLVGAMRQVAIRWDIRGRQTVVGARVVG